MSGHMGAEIFGVDLAEPLGPGEHAVFVSPTFTTRIVELTTPRAPRSSACSTST
nr:hypothetical protein [Pseudofrankia sp. DC12]